MRSLDTTQTFTTFEGEVVTYKKDAQDRAAIPQPLDLRAVILSYCKAVDRLGVSDKDQANAYPIGLKIAVGEVLSNDEYDSLKRMMDTLGLCKFPNGEHEYLWRIEVRNQAKEMVDKAVTVDEPKV